MLTFALFHDNDQMIRNSMQITIAYSIPVASQFIQ